MIVFQANFVWDNILGLRYTEKYLKGPRQKFKLSAITYVEEYGTTGGISNGKFDRVDSWLYSNIVSASAASLCIF